MEEQKIGDIIKREREKKGMSREDLAKALGLASREAIRRYEAGISTPREDTRLRLSEILEIPLSVLTGAPEGTTASSLKQARALGWLCKYLEGTKFNPQTMVACLQPKAMIKAYTLAAQSRKHDEALREISWHIEEFPDLLTKDEQAQFWMGYYTYGEQREEK